MCFLICSRSITSIAVNKVLNPNTVKLIAMIDTFYTLFIITKYDAHNVFECNNLDHS